MRAIILQATCYLAIAFNETSDPGFLQQGLDVGNTGHLAAFPGTVATVQGYGGCPNGEIGKAECDDLAACRRYADSVNKGVNIHTGWRQKGYPGGCTVRLKSNGAARTVYFNPNFASRRFPNWMPTLRYVCGCTPAMAGTPPPPAIPDEVCAEEGHRCRFSGTKIIRYWNYDQSNTPDAFAHRDKMHANGVMCTNENFVMGDDVDPYAANPTPRSGDPAPNKVKKCSIMGDGAEVCIDCFCHYNDGGWWGTYDDCMSQARPGWSGNTFSAKCRGKIDIKAEEQNRYPGTWVDNHACEGDTIEDVVKSKAECLETCRTHATCKCVTWLNKGWGAASCRLEAGNWFSDRSFHDDYSQYSAAIPVGKKYDGLVFGAPDTRLYEHRFGANSCHADLHENFSETAHSCVRFPFWDQTQKSFPHAIVGTMQFVGEFQACNRPGDKTSYVILNSAPNRCGLSGLGRIDWNCEYGFLLQCWPNGGVIGISRDWIAYMSVDCVISRAPLSKKLNILQDKKKSVVFKRPDNKEEANPILNIAGVTTLAFYLGGNKWQGLDFLVAIVGTVNVEALGLIGFGCNIKGQFILSTKKNDNPTFKITVRFEAEVRIIFAVFKLTCKVNYSPEEGWYWDFFVPFFLQPEKMTWKNFKHQFCFFCKDSWGSGHR